MSPSRERELGDRWAEKLRSLGAWVVKLPGSSLAGLPDWLVVQRPFGIRLVEAKVSQTVGAPFVPSQCTRAQRFFLEAIARHGGLASVLILGPESFYECRVYDTVRAVQWPEFLCGEKY